MFRVTTESPRRQTATILKSCELADVSRRTIYNWMKKNKVEFIRTAGGQVRIYTDSLFRPGEQPSEPKAKGESGLEELIGIETSR